MKQICGGHHSHLVLQVGHELRPRVSVSVRVSVRVSVSVRVRFNVSASVSVRVRVRFSVRVRVRVMVRVRVRVRVSVRVRGRVRAGLGLALGLGLGLGSHHTMYLLGIPCYYYTQPQGWANRCATAREAPDHTDRHGRRHAGRDRLVLVGRHEPARQQRGASRGLRDAEGLH